MMTIETQQAFSRRIHLAVVQLRAEGCVFRGTTDNELREEVLMWVLSKIQRQQMAKQQQADLASLAATAPADEDELTDAEAIRGIRLDELNRDRCA